jgi:hypothetical protein
MTNMKIKLSIILFLLIFCACKKSVKPPAVLPLTIKYAGVYEQTGGVDGISPGTLMVYPETDNKILFYLDISAGPPAYNMGSLYGRLVVVDDEGFFNRQYIFSDIPCRIIFEFRKDSIQLISIDDQTGCGFGHSVFADGLFLRRSTEIPEYFVNGDREKVFFGETSPDSFYKE